LSKIILTADFSSRTMEVSGSGITKVLKNENFQPRIFFQKKKSVKNEGRINSQIHKAELVLHRPVLKERRASA
jgi:hypothetical protein